MEVQQTVFCDENQIDILRQVFTITAQNGYKEEVPKIVFLLTTYFLENSKHFTS
jgi:hypothetical protein